MKSYDEFVEGREAELQEAEQAAREEQGNGFDVHVPSPVDAAAEWHRAQKDVSFLGIGFLVDGARVDPSRVTMFRGVHFPHVTTAELWKSLELVLIGKGASPEWIEYAMGDLQIAATQYAADQWGKGHAAGVAGEPAPNDGTPIVKGDPDAGASFDGAQGWGDGSVMPGLPSQTSSDDIPWNQPGSTQQSLGAALAEHGNGGD